jgi:hypothetical protein
MIKTTDHKAGRDRGALAREAKTETTERRQMFEMRRRPGYAAVEAKEPFQAEARLIRASDRLGAAEPNDEAIEPAGRPTFEEMRAQAEDFPPVPGEVREHERRKREQRRTAARVRKQAKRDRTKK